MAQGGRASSAMPLLPGTRASNERIVFVKNVPSYVPSDQIAELFAPYKPLSIKNIYKGSSITTIVVGFGSRSDAVRAQRNTDGKSLGSAVIKVEMYEQRRSLRYIKGQEQANLASSAGEKRKRKKPRKKLAHTSRLSNPFGSRHPMQSREVSLGRALQALSLLKELSAHQPTSKPTMRRHPLQRPSEHRKRQ